MNRVVVLLGFPSKEVLELAKYLEEAHGLRKFKTYTTKSPSRIDYLDYNFVTNTEFNRREKEGQFELLRVIQVPISSSEYVSLEHKYGLSKKDVKKGGVKIMNWDGYTDLLSTGHNNIVAFLIETDLDDLYYPDHDEHSSEDTVSKALRDRFLVDENKILLDRDFMDSMAKTFPIYKINASLPKNDIRKFVDQVLKEN